MNPPNKASTSHVVLRRKLSIALLTTYILSFTLATLPAAVVIEPTSPPTIIAQCGRGMLLDISGQRILLLAGTPYEMGYQQGYLLKNEIRKLNHNVLLVARTAGGADSPQPNFKGKIESAFERTRPFIDLRYLREMEGLAAGAQIPLEEVQLANIFPELFHCSGFSLFGQATEQGLLLHGRILDYMTEIGLQDLAVVTIAKPDGFLPFVTVGYAGFLGSVTGMNEQQIVVGEMGGRGEGSWDGMPMSFLVRKVLEEAAHLDQAIALFRDTPRTCEYYYVVSDGKIPDGRGLACTPDTFEIVLPGKAHPRLPHAIDDVVLMSADSRYETLAQWVQADFGHIGVNRALDLMNNPVAMKSCLHRVLFAPQQNLLWVSNAAPMEKEENYSAAYQPYYPYNFKTLLQMIPDQAPPSAQPIPPQEKTAADTDSKSSKKPSTQTEIQAEIPADLTRDLPPSSQPEINKLLDSYRQPDQAFPYHMKLARHFGFYSVYQVTFPSPLQTDITENNTVTCEYYQCTGDDARPAVILLDIMDGSMIVPRLIANSLVSNRVNAAIMYMPHYGPRKSQDKNKLRSMTEDPQVLIQAVEQAVMDIRRTARWLTGQKNIDANRIGLCGTSLGGFVAALTVGVDARFSKAAIIMAGGDLASVLMTDAGEVRSIKQHLQKMQIDRDTLQAMLAPIEPLTFADRLRQTNLLMVNGSLDTIVPPDCAKQLAQRTNTEIQWYPADHYDMVKHLFQILNHINQHFNPNTWPTQP